jgi:RNA polymerase sigma-B factor
VARRFSGLGESLDDLIQEGTIGLLKAVDLFDPERGVKFSTYACHLITSQIQHYLRDRGRLIRQPAWVQELNTKVARTTEQLTQELGRDPQLSEIAARLNLPESSVHNALAARELNSVASLNIPQEKTPETELSLIDKDKALANKLSALQFPIEERILLEEAVSSLKPLEQSVIQHYFFEDLNQSEIARRLGISVNYSSYLLRRAIAKIKTILEEQQHEESAALVSTHELDVAPPIDVPTYDHFTGLYTEAYLRARVAEEIARGRRYPTNFALMLVEIVYRPNALDTLPSIPAIGQLVKQTTRLIDLSAYLQHGRFALLLPHTAREARVLGERLIRQITGLPSTHATAPAVHFSYAVYPMDGTSVEGLFRSAEKALTIAMAPPVAVTVGE